MSDWTFLFAAAMVSAFRQLKFSLVVCIIVDNKFPRETLDIIL